MNLAIRSVAVDNAWVAQQETAGVSRPRGKRLPAETRRHQLLDTAAHLLVTRGIDALTMEAVAQEAGTSKTLGYAYFENSGHLVASLRARELRSLYQRLKAATEGLESFDHRVAAAVHAYFDTVAEKGMLLARLNEAVSARHIETDDSDGTYEFLSWLATVVDDEFGVGRRLSRSYAAVISDAANSHARLLATGRYRRAEIEERCVRFVLAGVRSALSAGLS